MTLEELPHLRTLPPRTSIYKRGSSTGATEEQAREAAATDTGAAGEDTDEAMPDAGAASEEEDMWAQPDKTDEQPHEVGTRLNARQTGHSRSLPTAFASTAYWQQMQKRSHSQGMA